jgi:hypothetical protein
MDYFDLTRVQASRERSIPGVTRVFSDPACAVVQIEGG